MCLRSGDGFPDVLVVDHDSKFTSEVFRAFVKGWGSCLIVGSAYQQQHVSFNDKSPKADNLRRGWMRGFQAFLREQQLVVALESVGSKTMNRKMKSTLQGEFDGIPSRRDQPNKWAQHIQLPPAIQLENHSSEDPRK